MIYRGYCGSGTCLYTHSIIIMGLNNKLLFVDDATASASVAVRKHL